jgi:hypothetical protein
LRTSRRHSIAGVVPSRSPGHGPIIVSMISFTVKKSTNTKLLKKISFVLHH